MTSHSALTSEQIQHFRSQSDGWQQQDQHINKTYAFKDYYQTIAFVNALAWMAHQTDHHPELTVSYNRCTVNYSTHDAGGLTEKDFICAAHADRLFKP